MKNKMTHKTVVVQCSNDVDLDDLLVSIQRGTKGLNVVTYELNEEGQSKVEQALPSLTHHFDFLQV